LKGGFVKVFSNFFEEKLQTPMKGTDNKSNSCRLHLLNRQIFDGYIDDVFEG